jgi:hypothetical protein
LPFVSRGGCREGAGRKRIGERPRVPHDPRPVFAGNCPVLVTVRVRPGLPSLRASRAYRVLEGSFTSGSERFGFRVVHHSVQPNHLQLIVEADDERALARGMKGLLVRAARGLNKAWGRTGALVEDHYHARVLRTPSEVRHALVYVLQNSRKHGTHLVGLDPCSSAAAFDGWSTPTGRRTNPSEARSETWLLSIGWKKLGLISPSESPAIASKPREAGPPVLGARDRSSPGRGSLWPAPLARPPREPLLRPRALLAYAGFCCLRLDRQRSGRASAPRELASGFLVAGLNRETFRSLQRTEEGRQHIDRLPPARQELEQTA